MNQGDSNKTFAPETLGNMTLGLCIETLHKYFYTQAKCHALMRSWKLLTLTISS